MASGAPSREQFAYLEGLRGIAIALVLLAHAHVPGLKVGLFGVDVFFVLSGYLITRSLLVWTGTGVGRTAFYVAFLLRRVARLVPALAAALLLLAVWVALTDVVDGGSCLVRAATYTMNLPIGHAQECRGPLHVMWSLAAEQQFYLLWPLVLVLLTRVRTAPVVVATYIVAVLVLGFLALRDPDLAGALNYSPAGRPLALLPGAAVALARPAKRRLPGGAVLFVAGLVGVALLLKDAPQVVLGPLVAVPAALLVRDLRRGPSLLRDLLSHPLLTYLGRISYSLYLVHLLVLYVTRDVVPGRLADVVGCVLAVGLAELLYRFVEDPCRRRGYALVRASEARRAFTQVERAGNTADTSAS